MKQPAYFQAVLSEVWSSKVMAVMASTMGRLWAAQGRGGLGLKDGLFALHGYGFLWLHDGGGRFKRDAR